MRYTRLRRQIESGTLIGTHGTPFAGGAEKIAEAYKKRKRPRREEEQGNMDEDATERQDVEEDSKSFKLEPHSSSSGYETNTSSEDSDSEAEVPLAKRRPCVARPTVITNDVSMMQAIESIAGEQQAYYQLDLEFGYQDAHSAPPSFAPPSSLSTEFPASRLELPGSTGMESGTSNNTLPDMSVETAL